MGLHHGGKRLDIAPFEVEMRRLIWWQAVANGSRLAILSSQQPVLPKNWDTKKPQNVNDADMFPGSHRPIRSRDGPTEMVHVLLMNYVHEMYISGGGFILQSGEDARKGNPLNMNAQLTLQRAEHLAGRLEEGLHDLERQFVNGAVGPVHTAALVLRRFMTGGLVDVFVPLMDQPEWGTEILGPRDLLFNCTISV
ncbi:C6 transcription factor, putative [Metarhizium acridum CQMa 102]|uniref:C6 transcription factor, putative n=1 Tax=Metarhizium acridum (strain CQMa 102) TaxID=655827 RepID=E9EGG7_METAQ|nr:C6 transcription factor, putative [Metarhizium acridum CQMa 102]EFY84981.1 C6 transcription factor, putative [Metarhizium acridum CQMa 102]